MTLYAMTPVELFGPRFVMLTVQITTSSKSNDDAFVEIVILLSTLGITLNDETFVIPL